MLQLTPRSVKKFCISSTQNRSHVRDKKKKDRDTEGGEMKKKGERQGRTPEDEEIESKKIKKRKNEKRDKKGKAMKDEGEERKEM